MPVRFDSLNKVAPSVRGFHFKFRIVLWETQRRRMILRTPPPKRPRANADADADADADAAEVDRQLVIYEDPPESSQEPSVSEHMLCTYQCRQMVSFPFSFCINVNTLGLI